MDSITQFALGAGVASVCLGSKLGWRAVITGGLVATLPDLDSFIPYDSRLDAVTYHRGFSHSLFVQTAVAPLVAFVVHRIFKNKFHLNWWRVLLTVWLCLITHSLLDSLTTYGTQLFWPLTAAPPVAIPSIFIIDPVYTILLISGIVGFWIFSRSRPKRAMKFARLGLAASLIYLGLGFSAHMMIKSRAQALPDLAGMRVHVQPTPFNIFYWQVLAIDKAKILTGATSVLNACDSIDFKKFDRKESLTFLNETLPEDVKRFEWFTDGFFTYRQNGNLFSISDLRIGFSGIYPFSYSFAELQKGQMILITPQRAKQPQRDLKQLTALYNLASEIPKACS